MELSIIIELIQNLTLVIALSVLLHRIALRWERRQLLYRLMVGLLFGLVAIVAMMAAIRATPGLLYDGRTIALALAGMIGGPISAGIAAFMAAAYRLYLGGIAATIDVAIIVEAATLGSGYFYLCRRNPQWLHPLRLWAFSIIIHLGTLGLYLFLPNGLGIQVLHSIGLPVLLFYPLGFLLSAYIFLESKRWREAETEAAQSHRQLQHLLHHSPTVIYSLQLDFTPRRISPNIQKILGYSPEEALRPEWWRSHLHPEDREIALRRSVTILTTDHLIHKYRFLKSNGDIVWIRDELRLLRDSAGNPTEIIGSWTNITEQMQAERSFAYQNRILELIATGAPLTTTLTALATEIETQSPGMLASILLLDEDGLHMRHGAAPNLPADYCRAVDGLSIGERVGSCGTAMYQKETVIVEDIATDPLWEDYREMTLSHGLRACWSTPIFDEHGRVLGSFALYSRTPFRPTADQEKIVAQATNLAAIAILRHRQEEALRRERDFALQVMENLGQGLNITDAEGRFTYVNPAYAALLGYQPAELLGRSIQTVIDEATQPLFDEILARRKAGERSTYETRLRHRDGHLIPVLIAGVPRFQENRYIGSIAVITDISERIRNEEAIRQSEERFRLLAGSSLTGTYLIQDDHFVYVNQALAALFGYQVEELVGKLGPLDLTVPEDREAVAKNIRQRIEGDIEALRSTFRGLRKDGSIFHAEVYSRCVLWEGRPGILGTLIDISDYRRRERELLLITNLSQTLRLALTRHEILPELLDQILVQMEVDGVALEVLEPASGALFTELARGIWEPLIGESIPAGAGLSAHILETGQPYFNNHARTDPRLYRPDAFGECRAIAGVPIITEGKIIGLLWIGSRRLLQDEDLLLLQAVADMAAGALHRAMLYERNEVQARQMRQILHTIPQGIFLLNATGQIVMVNPAATQHLAVLADAGPGDILTHLGELSLQEVFTSPSVGTRHEIHAEARTYEVIARSIPNGPEPEHWVILIDDVTRSRQIQAQIQQQERLATVGQLAAGIAHDFNNIITVIVLNAQMALYSPGLPPHIQERLQTIEQQAQHATTLIRQILDFSRRSVLEQQPVDLLTLVKDQIKLLERTLPESIQIHLKHGTDNYLVNADPTRLRQVLLNLVINARDAMVDGGRLDIELEQMVIGHQTDKPGQRQLEALPGMQPGQWLILRVRDAGTGIPEEVLPHIFEPFFTTKGPGKGTGLGLAQVHGIISQHGGYIDVESKVGKGTTFTLYLPALTQSHQPAATAAIVLPEGQDKNILLVEDNQALRVALRENLKQWGYRVYEAAHGREALSILAQATDVDAIITDIVMPEMGGIALANTLRQQGWTKPIVLISGHPLEMELFHPQEYDISAWLSKPLSMAQLAQVLSDIFKKPENPKHP